MNNTHNGRIVSTAVVIAVAGFLVWNVGCGRKTSPVRQSSHELATGEETGCTPPAFQPVVKSLDLGGDVKLEMVSCPGAGRDFWVGKYEVTQEQWQRVTGTNPSHFGGKPKNPVENVCWNECQDFVGKLNALPAARASGLTFRLPTAEEWETACRAGAPESADYCKLADGTQITVSTLDSVAWFGGDWDKDSTHPAGQKQPNAWGLHDMHGNVWEWTETAEGEYRVHRGGSFAFTAGNCAAGLRLRGNPGGDAARDLGFRLAASGKAAIR